MDTSYMITYTYDDNHITRSDQGNLSLDHRPISDSIKRLRSYEKKINPFIKIRYFAIGEYGGKTKRPHHHIIFFNIQNTDNVIKSWRKKEHRDKKLAPPIVEKSKNGEIRLVYTPKKHHTYGRISIDQLTNGTRKYVANYMVKKRWTTRPQDVRREYTACSQGIGHQLLYNDQFINQIRNNPTRRLIITKEGYKMPLPRYYYKKIFHEWERRLLYYEYLYTDPGANIIKNDKNLLNISKMKLNTITQLRE